MGSRFKAEKPESHQYTMTITMSLEDWMQVRDELCGAKGYSGFPSSKVVRLIDDMTSQAKKIYWPEEPEDQ